MPDSIGFAPLRRLEQSNWSKADLRQCASCSTPFRVGAHWSGANIEDESTETRMPPGRKLNLRWSARAGAAAPRNVIVCLSRAAQFPTVQRSMVQSGHGRAPWPRIER